MTLNSQEKPSSSSFRKAPSILAFAAAAAVMATMAPDAEAGNRQPKWNQVSSKHAQPELTNLQDANTVASALATSYTDCHAKKSSLDSTSLTFACNDFKRVTRFGSKYGQGENPTDAWGNTVDWRALATWLGLEDWLDEHIAEQARLIRTQQSSPRVTQVSANSRQKLADITPMCMREEPKHRKLPIVAKQQQKFQSIKMPRWGTLYGLAQFQKTSVANLKKWNNISDVTKVREGQTIKFIPGVK
jgi:hypothetical protein